MNLYDHLTAATRARSAGQAGQSSPAAVAADVFLDPPAGEGPPLRWADLDARTAQVRGALAAFGVQPGGRVLAQVDKSVASIELYLGCLRHGAVFVPVNTAYTPAEVADFVADAEPTLVVTERDEATFLDAVAASAPIDETVERGDDDLAAICYTSGTTGRSKGAMLTHGNLASNAAALHDLWQFVPGDVLLHTLPTYHVHGLFVALHTAMLNGSRVLFHRRFVASEAVAALAGGAATVYMGVPTNYVRLLAEPGFDRAACGSMRLFVSGSAPLLASTHEEFVERTGHTILERYGMTETGMITSNPYPSSGRVAGTVGYPLPGVDVRVNTSGVLEVRGPNVTPGYWKRDRSRADFPGDGWFVTGDLAAAEADGRISLVGRAKDLIISGGLNVYPKEIEDLIDAVPGVAESAVIGLPHADLGEAVVAVITIAPGADVTEADLAAALDGRLARFKQPKRLVLVDDLPRNAMGKVQKNVLRARFADLFS